MRRPKKLLEPDPRLLYCPHTFTFTDFLRKIYSPVIYHIGYVEGLVLLRRGSVDARKLEKLLDSVKDGRNWFLKMVSHLLDDVPALKEFVQHQLPIVLL